MLWALLLAPGSTAVADEPLLALEVTGDELPELEGLELGADYDAEAAEEIDALLSSAAARLAAEGYFDAAIRSSLERVGGGVIVAVDVRRGPRALLNELTINGAVLLDPREIDAVARAGWRRDGPRGLRGAVVALCTEHGLLEAEVRLGGLSLEDDRASLHLEIEEGRPVTVEAVRFSGVDGPSGEATARRVSGLETGAVLNSATLDNARRRLMSSGYYRDVALRWEPDDGVVVVELEPGARLRLDGALGLYPTGDGETGLFGQAELDWLRIGGPRDLHLLFRRSDIDDADYRLNYRERRLGGSVDLIADFSGLRRPERRSDALSIDFEHHLTPRLTLVGGLRGSLDSERDRGESSYLGLGVGMLFDDRDEPLNPRRGLVLELRGEAGRRWYDAERSSPLRLTARSAFHWTPVEPHTLALALEGGYAWLTHPAIADLFYLGGAAGPRGYRAEELPTDRYLGGGLEYRLRLGDSGRAFAFADGLYRLPASILPLLEVGGWETAWSYGVGVFVDLGGGGLEVVYAVPAEAELADGVVQARLVLEVGF